MSEVINKIEASATYQTIVGQVAEIRRLYKEETAWEGAERAAQLLAGARRIFLVGTGTSFHAAQMGQYLLRSVGITEAWAVTAFDFALYPQPLTAEDVVILFSHRGSKLFSRQSLEKVQAVGAGRIVITGQASPLVEEAAETALVLQTTAQERSSTHTASYVTAMTVLIQIVSFLAEKKGQLDIATRLRLNLKEVPQLIETAIAQQAKIATAARQMGGDGVRLFFTGAGPGGITAVEGALKCKEAAYVTAEGSPLETLLHGPLVSLGLGDHLVMLNTFREGPAAERTAQVARAVEQIGVKVWLVGQMPLNLAGTAWVELAAPGGDDICANLGQVVPLQLLSCFLAEVRGTNPDSFRLEFADYKAAIGAIKL